MARRPLIPPGTLDATGAQPLSLQEKIIARDAEKNGRPAPKFGNSAETSFNTDSNITSNTESNITAHITAQEDSQTDGQEDALPRAQEPVKASRSEGAKPPTKKTVRQYAQEMGETTAIPITLRLPEGLNDYLDEQAHRHRKSKVLKQDLVRLAVQLLVEEIEDGTDVVALLKGGR
ncbi:MAG: hypothetical protein H8F28_01380 [Fibrella sp.]|nr:hypothetical protein [Armatimonadota bacterium]